MNEYDWWERALAGEEIGGPALPIHEDSPQSGFFRKRASKAGAYLPVAIWRGSDGALIGLLDGRETNPADLWTYCAPHPISEEHYRSRIDSGKWFDEDESVTASLVPPQVGHNSGSELESLQDMIDSALEGVSDYEQITSDATAAKAQSLRSRLLELSGDADKAREKLVRPHLDAQGAINADYMPLVKSAKSGADLIRAALKAHENRKDVEAKARLLEEAKKQAAEAFKHAPLGSEPPKPVATHAPAAAPIKGSYGRAASVKVVKRVVITDLQAVFTFFKEQPDVAEFFAKKVKKAVDAGFTIPGVEVTEEKDIV